MFYRRIQLRMHLVFECAALAPGRQQYTSLFTVRIHTMQSCFVQEGHLEVFGCRPVEIGKLHTIA